MMNQVVLIGRLTKNPELIESEKGNKYSFITLAIPRNYKNAEGIYETDFINCKLFSAAAETTSEYLKQGDLIGIRGRLQPNSYEKDGEKKFSLDVITDKVIFLNSKDKHNEKNEINDR